MLAGNQLMLAKHKKDASRNCPHTIIYDVVTPSANWTHMMGVKNANNVSAAFIDWGDGVTESLRSSGEYFSLFRHTYNVSGTYTVTFDMNAEFSPSSYFMMQCPSELSGKNLIINEIAFGEKADLDVTVKDFDYIYMRRSFK